MWTQNGLVVAYFTLAGHVINGNVPARLGRGSPDRIPAVFIARLALHETLQGRGLGGLLLADAASRIVAATDIVATHFVVVDAIDEHAAEFYSHYGFARISDSQRLVRKIGDLIEIPADVESPHHQANASERTGHYVRRSGPVLTLP